MKSKKSSSPKEMPSSPLTLTSVGGVKLYAQSPMDAPPVVWSMGLGHPALPIMPENFTSATGLLVSGHCTWAGCLSHVDHPCESCGRIAGKLDPAVRAALEIMRRKPRSRLRPTPAHEPSIADVGRHCCDVLDRGVKEGLLVPGVIDDIVVSRQGDRIVMIYKLNTKPITGIDID